MKGMPGREPVSTGERTLAEGLDEQFDQAADYALAWRWLIRDLPGNIRPIGWSPIESHVLRRSGDRPQQDAKLKTWIVNADEVHPRSADICELQGVSCLVLVGKGAHVGLWERAIQRIWGAASERAEYGLIPPKRPRLAISLQTRESVSAGLRFHSPGGLGSRLAVTALRYANNIGLKFPLRSREVVVLIRGQCTSNERQEVRPSTCGVYFGVQGHRRKTVSLIRSGGAYAVCKSASTAKARQLLRSEADALEILRGTCVSTYVPRVLNFADTVAGTNLEMEFRSGGRAGKQVELKLVLEFLARLARTNLKPHALDDFIAARLERWRAGVNVHLRRQFAEIAERVLVVGDRQVWTAFTHGDLARWNTAVTREGLFVFDWEDFNPDGLQLSDLFRWISADMLLLRRRPNSQQTAIRALQVAHQFIRSSQIEACVQTQFVLWCLSQMDAYRPDFYLAAAEAALNAKTKSI